MCISVQMLYLCIGVHLCTDVYLCIGVHLCVGVYLCIDKHLCIAVYLCIAVHLCIGVCRFWSLSFLCILNIQLWKLLRSH